MSLIDNLPKKYKDFGTLVVKSDLSDGANIFMHVSPIILNGLIAKYGAHNIYAAARQAYEVYANEFSGEKTFVASVRGSVVKSENYEIPIRIYQPKNHKSDEVILYVHGGGWNKGNLNTHDELCRRLCAGNNITLVAVDYRLAPEHKFPSGFEDVIAAYQWLLESFSNLLLNNDTKIICVGDSAGGNLITALNLWLMAEDKTMPVKNILMYPALDLRVPKVTDNIYADGYLLTQQIINYYVQVYVNGENETNDNLYISPILAKDEHLKKLPETLIISAECDPLTEQADKFIEKARVAGNTKIHHYVEKNTIHAFAQFFGLFEEAEKTLVRMNKFLKSVA